MNIGYSILLEACDPERNIWRSYHIAAGQDLFGNWIVELTYGRINCKGRTKVLLAADEEEAKSLIKACLRKRESARKRIGIGYTVKSVIGTLEGISSITDGAPNPEKQLRKSGTSK